MQVIGFNFSKISGQRSQDIKPPFNVNTSVELTNVEKEKVSLIKEGDPLKVSFQVKLSYLSQDSKDSQKKDKQEPGAELVFEGFLVLLGQPEENKELLKSWKKKEYSNEIKVPLINIVLERCSVKALELEESLGLPFFPSLPKISAQVQNPSQS